MSRMSQILTPRRRRLVEESYEFEDVNENTGDDFVSKAMQNLQRDVDKYLANAEENPRGNLKESGKLDEAGVSVDDILGKWKQDNKGKIESVKINDIMFDGVNCEVKFKDGHTEELDVDTDASEIQKTLNDLKRIDSRATNEDAIVALVRIKVDPEGGYEWFVDKVSLKDWTFDDDISDLAGTSGGSNYDDDMDDPEYHTGGDVKSPEELGDNPVIDS